MVEGRRVLVICSGGGHLKEAMSAVGGVVDGFHLATFKTAQVDGLSGIRSVTRIIDPHLSKAKYLLNLLQGIVLLLKIRPRVVVTTGAGIAVPTCLIAKKMGAKLVVVDTVACPRDLSRTGRFLYRYADLFVVQWPDLVARYPKAVYGGTVL